MRAIVVRETGSLDSLVFEDLPDPEPSAGEVVVMVSALGVNGGDVNQTQPGEPRTLRQPRVMGGDAAGTVSAVGAGVSSIAVGQRVVVNPGVSCGVCVRCLSGRDNICAAYSLMGYGNLNGGYAEYVVVPEANVVRLPDEVSFVDAATIPIVWITAWHMLYDIGRLEPGETVLVEPAGSGVGTAAIQLARMAGARVIAAAGSQWKLDQVQELGADAGVDYTDEGWPGKVRDLADGRGVDVVIDASRGAAFDAAIGTMAMGGRAVTAAPGQGSTVEVRRLFRDQTVSAVLMGPKSSLPQIVDHFRTGRLRPVIHAVYPIAEIKKAHEDLLERRAFGKVVMTWD
jgi:NADPH:quinone reductase-like Zn-dependent oxidoreductase